MEIKREIKRERERDTECECEDLAKEKDGDKERERDTECVCEDLAKERGHWDTARFLQHVIQTRYRMSKKYCPICTLNLQYTNGQDLLDT